MDRGRFAKIDSSMSTQYDSCVFVDADDVEKGSHQTRHIVKLDMAALGLAQGNPVENASCSRKIDTNQPGTGNNEAIGSRQSGLKFVQGICRITQHLAAQLYHCSGYRVQPHEGCSSLTQVDGGTRRGSKQVG